MKRRCCGRQIIMLWIVSVFPLMAEENDETDIAQFSNESGQPEMQNQSEIGTVQIGGKEWLPSPTRCQNGVLDTLITGSPAVNSFCLPRCKVKIYKYFFFHFGYTNRSHVQTNSNSKCVEFVEWPAPKDYNETPFILPKSVTRRRKRSNESIGKTSLTNRPGQTTGLHVSKSAIITDGHESNRKITEKYGESNFSEKPSERLNDLEFEQKSSDQKPATTAHPEETDLDATRNTTIDTSQVKRVEVDYASKSAGAVILEHSKNFQGTSHLLEKDMDRYALIPCDEPTKFVVIGLSEDILVKTVVLANYERYSSHTKDFNVAVRSTTVGEWNDLGTYTAEPIMNRQAFHLNTPTWARYLKIQFLTHHGNEDYCTMSQISVHGSTMVQGFHEQWVVDDRESEIHDAVRGISLLGKKAAHEYNDENLSETDATNNSLWNHPDSQESMTSDGRTENTNSSFINLSSDYHGDEKCNFNLSDYMNAVFDFCPSESMTEVERKLFLVSYTEREDEERRKILPSSKPTDSIDAKFTKSNENSPLICQQKSSECTERMEVPVRSSKAGSAEPIGSEGVSNDGKLVVERIKQLIRTTAGAVDEIGNSLRQRGGSASDMPVVEDDYNAKTLNLRSGSNNSSSTIESNHRETAPSPANFANTKVDSKLHGEEMKTFSTDSGNWPSGLKTDSYLDLDAAVLANNVKLTAALKKLTSAKCLEKLDFKKYKTDVLSSRAGTTGAQGQTAPGNAMEPIFKLLTDEIKALHANMVVHDNFSRDSALCYQNVILDIMLEMEKVQSSQELRIYHLEKQLQAWKWTDTFSLQQMKILFQTLTDKVLRPILDSVWWCVDAGLSIALRWASFVLFNSQSTFASLIRWTIMVIIFVYLVYRMGLRIIWLSPGWEKSSSEHKVQRHIFLDGMYTSSTNSNRVDSIATAVSDAANAHSVHYSCGNKPIIETNGKDVASLSIGNPLENP